MLKQIKRMKDLLLNAQVVVKTTKCGNFALLFCRLRHGIVLECVPHVQHAYCPPFDQSNSDIVALSLPLLSSILTELPNKHT